MNEAKVNRYLFEIAGCAGTQFNMMDVADEPEYNKAFRLFFALPADELSERLKNIKFDVVQMPEYRDNQSSEYIINWSEFLYMSQRHDKYRCYWNSPEWKRKRDYIIAVANSPLGGGCQMCGNPARVAHHLKQDNYGCESVADLQALCKGCHADVHNKR